MDVYVFVFEHRHGCDISAHASAEGAYAAAAEIARRDWAEARQCERTLPASPPADDIEAVEMYFEARAGHEFYAIVSCEVEGIGCRDDDVVTVPADPSPQPKGECPVDEDRDPAEAIDLLFDAAYDSELAMLQELVERAGLAWKCRVEVAGSPGHYMNVDAARCGDCGAEEKEGKEDPDG